MTLFCPQMVQGGQMQTPRYWLGQVAPILLIVPMV